MWPLDSVLRMSKGQSAESIRTQVQSIDPYEFEDFVADMWEKEGWDTSVSKGSNDMGVDVVAQKSGTIGQKAVIQAKRYSDGNKVGRPKIQQYHSLKQQDTEADAAVVVTTSDFTDQARLWAHDHNVKLVDGDELADMVRKHNAEALVEQYASSEKSKSTTSSTQKESSESSSSFQTLGQDGGYFKAVLVTAGAQIFGATVWGLPSAVPALSPGAGMWILIATMFTAPAAIFLDSLYQHNTDASYKPNRVTWPLFSFIVPVIVPVWYVLRRL